MKKRVEKKMRTIMEKKTCKYEKKKRQQVHQRGWSKELKESSGPRRRFPCNVKT
jgi:hypothetical protein